MQRKSLSIIFFISLTPRLYPNTEVASKQECGLKDVALFFNTKQMSCCIKTVKNHSSHTNKHSHTFLGCMTTSFRANEVETTTYNQFVTTRTGNALYHFRFIYDLMLMYVCVRERKPPTHRY